MILVVKARSVLAWIDVMLGSVDLGSLSSSGSSGSANSVGGFIMKVRIVGVSGVIVTFSNSGHLRDQAGWFPLQNGHWGSVLGHLFGTWLFGHVGQIGFLGHSEVLCPSVKHLEH